MYFLKCLKKNTITFETPQNDKYYGRVASNSIQNRIVLTVYCTLFLAYVCCTLAQRMTV